MSELHWYVLSSSFRCWSSTTDSNEWSVMKHLSDESYLPIVLILSPRIALAHNMRECCQPAADEIINCLILKTTLSCLPAPLKETSVGWLQFTWHSNHCHCFTTSRLSSRPFLYLALFVVFRGSFSPSMRKRSEEVDKLFQSSSQ